MSELLIPGNYVNRERPYGPFDRDFFAAHFQAGLAPSCEIDVDGDTPVVELELASGETVDVAAFTAFKKDHLVAQLYVDPPSCDGLYLSFLRYEAIFRINIRSYDPPSRTLGFRVDTVPEVEEGPVLGEAADGPLLGEAS
tara:strand:+ start:117 stop:536 length:420 start_codon:yes stop_codon:yes gene_type:complete